MSRTSPTRTAESAAGVPHRWAALAVLALAQFVLILDSTVVNVALPSIQRDFETPDAQLAWITNGYGLAFGGLLLLGGSLGDLYGRRKMFVIGIGLFSAASLVAGLAWNVDVLIVTRFVQGVGAALAAPAALSSISRIFIEEKERARALGAWGGLSALGGTLGVVISGVIVELTSWRGVFIVTVPATVLAMVMAPRFVPESRAPSRPRLDVPGALLVTSAMALAVFAFLDKGTAAWTDATLLARLGLALLLVVVFVSYEARAAQPMVPLVMLKNRTRSVGVLVSMAFGSMFATYFFTTTLYMQTVLDYPPLKTGFAYLPFGLTVLVAFPAISILTGRIGIKPVMIFGLGMAFTGLLVLTQIAPDGTYLGDVLPGMCLLALGAACGFVTFTIAGVDGTTDENAGIASGILNAGGQIGSALGLATLVAVAVTVQADRVASGVGIEQAAVDGYTAAYSVAAGVIACATVLAIVVLKPRRGTPRPEATAAAATNAPVAP